MNKPPVVSRIWLHLCLIIAVLVLLLIVCGVLWYRSDSDLRRIDARAKVLGVATTWEAWGLKTAAAERVEIWKRCADLSDNQLPKYPYNSIAPEEYPPLKNFNPIPELLLKHLASLPADKVEELMTLIELLRDEPLALRDHVSLLSSQPEILTLRQLTEHLRHIAVVAPKTEIPLLRMVTAIRSFHCMSICSYLVKRNTAHMAFAAVVNRLPELKGHVPQLADQLDQLVQGFDHDLQTALLSEFITFRLAFEKPDSSELMTWMSCLGVASDGPHPVIPRSLPLPVLVRCGRETVLDRLLDSIQATHHMPVSRGQLTNLWNSMAPDTGPSLWNNFRFSDEFPLLIHQNYDGESIAKFHHQSQLRLTLLAAELRQKPWPVDLFDPSGKPLRRYERAGKLIGAYSVGSDGVDDGGVRKTDIVFPLYGPWEAPVPGSP